MAIPSRPGFLNACLVAENSRDAPPLGGVRKDGNASRIVLFGVPGDQQPGEVFQTRGQAKARLLDSYSVPELRVSDSLAPEPAAKVPTSSNLGTLAGWVLLRGG